MNGHGARIRAMRRARGYSMRELGEYIGLPRQTIWKIEDGRRTLTFDEAVAVCKFFDVSLDAFAGRAPFTVEFVEVVR